MSVTVFSKLTKGTLSQAQPGQAYLTTACDLLLGTTKGQAFNPITGRDVDEPDLILTPCRVAMYVTTAAPITDTAGTFDNMRQQGGHFASALATAASYADSDNLARLLNAFPELFATYATST